MTLYIGSVSELVQIEFDEKNPSFHTRELNENENLIYKHISLPNILYLGSDEGCGCGFRHALLDNNKWFIVESEENLDNQIGQTNHRDLYNYIKDNIANGSSIHIYGCWNGDLMETSKSVEEIVLEDILHEQFYFKERGLYVIDNGS